MENISSEKELSQKATQSLKWSAMMEVISRAASPIITVILARLLIPEDFGIVATAQIVISFSTMFWDAGLSRALMQINKDPEEAAHVVFWTNLALGIVVYLFLFLSAPYIAAFFKSPASSPVLQVLGLQIILSSLSSVQRVLFVRDLDFRALFWIRLITAFLPGFCSIPLAFFGYGVWALVVGSLAGQMLNLALLWRASFWRPGLKYNIVIAKKMFGFGAWVSAQGFASWLIMWADSVIIGRYLGTEDLGIYRTGWNMIYVIFGLVINPFSPVMAPTFSRLQDNLPALREAFYKVNKIVMAMVIPMGIGLLFVGDEAADLLFGSKWIGLGFVLRYVGFREAISYTFCFNGTVCSAMGRPDIFAKLDYAFLLWIIPTYVISARFGLETFVYVRVINTFIGLLIYTYLFHRVVGVSPFYLWHQGKEIIFSALAMAMIIWIMKSMLYFFSAPKIVILATIILMGIFSYMATLWFLNRKFLIKTFQLIRQAVA
jgi:PST family polysaccharide transporter